MWLTLTLVDHGTPLTKSFLMATPLVDDVQRRASIVAGEERAARARYSNRVADITRTLGEEPGVDVIRMAPGPGDEEWIRLDPIVTTGGSGTVPITQAYRSVAISRVDSQFFGAFNLHLLGGRRFTATDFALAAPAALVNRAFVERILGGANPVGRRIRQEASLAKDGVNAGAALNPSWEIVGVVEDFPKPETQGASTPMVYLPLRPAGVYPITLAVRAPSLRSAALSERIRMVSLSIDPTLRFTSIRTLDDVLNAGLEGQRLGVLALVLVLVSVVLLSAAGIYALMAFTVTRRQREIGIRMALGARSGRVLVGVLSHALRQIGTGIAIGVLLAPVAYRLVGNSSTWTELGVQVAGMAAMAILVGVLATIGPARRALRVQPTEALRTD
jgi:ABC-type antimicrobial peptide transport system permease subunit